MSIKKIREDKNTMTFLEDGKETTYKKDWTDKDEEDYNEHDKFEKSVSVIVDDWDSLPKWKQKLYNNQMNNYYKEKKGR